MSLPRNEQTEQTSNQPLLNLDDLWAQMLTMRQDSAQSAEDKFQVALLLATINKLCAEQTTFISKTESKLIQINNSQLKTLNLQEQYKNEIAATADRLLRNTYNAIRERQETVLQIFAEQNNEAIEEMNTAVKNCTEQINKAANHAENATKNLFRITRIADLMYYIAPAAVLADLLFRVIQFFA